MSRIHSLFRLYSAILLLLLAGCSNDSEIISIPPISPLSVTVLDGSTSPATAVANANIQVIDTASGMPVATLTSDSNGTAAGLFAQQSVQLKVTAQGYAPSPSANIPPLPISLTPFIDTPVTITLQPLDPSLQLASISGQVLNHLSGPLPGALVVAEDASGNSVAVNSDHNGAFRLFNVPAGNITLSAWYSGYNFPVIGPLTLADGDNLSGQLFLPSSFATGAINGHVSFTATSGNIIDITLLHPGSRQVLPGMRVYTDGGASYAMFGVPNGTFEIIASLENDNYVLDPDTAVTQGIPLVTVSNDVVTKDFKVTGSITLTSPPPFTGSALPQLPTLPTFSWVKDSSYASAEEYVVEVLDESSNTIWGGFGPAPAYLPQVTVPQADTPTTTYNFDGTATQATLTTGGVYQLRVYAKKSDGSDPRGYKLLSSSETLDGLFRVVAP